MPDWPGVAMQPPVICTGDGRSGATGGVNNAPTPTTGTWPAANRAIYMPFEVQATCTAFQIGFIVAVQSGNLDVGIYDIVGPNRLVSKGSTAVAAAGVQVVDITNTTLTPGAYFLAMCVDNTTASFNTYVLTALLYQAAGVQQQAVGAVTLPDPATFANPASAYCPLMFVSTGQATI